MDKMMSISALILVFATVGSLASPYVVTWKDPSEVEREDALLGENMCTRGPSYWCYNITQAAECKAVKHCIKKVWEDARYPEDDDSVCKVCKDMIKQARDQLLSNQTEEELKEVLEGSCNLIPVNIVSKECRKLADDFIPELVDTLASRMDPNTVCSISGLCNSLRIDEMLGEMKPLVTLTDLTPKLGALDCPKCNYFMEKLAGYIKGFDKRQLKLKIFEICGHFGSYSDACRMSANENIELIYDHIQKDMRPSEICGLFGICQISNFDQAFGAELSTEVKVWTPPNNVNDDDLECDFCKKMTEYGREWLIADTTKVEFKQIAQGLCRQTRKYEDECLRLAKEYGQFIYDVLVEELDPNSFCERLTLCKNSDGVKRIPIFQDDTPIWTILKGNDDTKNPEMKRLLAAERMTGDDEIYAKDESTIECQFCQYFFHYVQEYLVTPKTDRQLEKYIDEMCDRYMPSEYAEQCNQFVDQYGDSILALLAQGIDPSQVCPSLKICPVELLPSPDAIEDSKAKVGSTPCYLCSLIIEELIDYVGGEPTKESIDAAVDEICFVIPKAYTSRCLNFMKTYGEVIAEKILLHESAHEVCVALHLCFASDDPKNISVDNVEEKTIQVDSVIPFTMYNPYSRIQPSDVYFLQYKAALASLNGDQRIDEHEEINDSQKDSTQCVVCQYVMVALANRLHDRASEEEIRDEVEHICLKFPKTLSKKCETFVETYGEMIIEYLVNSFDPKQICVDLDLCNDDQEYSKQEMALYKDQMAYNYDRCWLCEAILERIDTSITDPNMATRIEKFVEKICPTIPQVYQNDCVRIIEDYGPYFLTVIHRSVEKGVACQRIGMCSAAAATGQ